jgi:hypothetical protein
MGRLTESKVAWLACLRRPERRKVAQGQLGMKGKDTEEKKGDICLVDEIQVSGNGRLPRREGEAGKQGWAGNGPSVPVGEMSIASWHCVLYSILLLYDRTLENQNGLSFFSPNPVASPSSKFIDSYSSNSNLFHRPNGRDRSVSVI